MPVHRKEMVGVYPSSEEVVSWLAHNINDVFHLQREYLESHIKALLLNLDMRVGQNVTVCTYLVTYRLVLAVRCKSVLGDVQEHEHTAETPHVYGLADGEAQEDFRCPVWSVQESQELLSALFNSARILKIDTTSAGRMIYSINTQGQRCFRMSFSG